MPKLNREEIVAAIAAQKMKVVSIDTSVFYSKNRHFRDATLTLLGQFKDGPVQFVVSEIVSKEMKLRLSDDARKTQIALKSALRKMNVIWNRPHDDFEREKLSLLLSPEEYADAEFDLFKSKVGFQVISLNEGKASLAELFDRFFSSNPPFGKSEARKYEFPDAAALISLENYAKESNSLILCVAQDKGWLDFAEQSSHIVCFYPLEAVLAMFNEASQHQSLADSIVDVWRRDGSESFEKVVQEPITSGLEMLNFEIDADCNFILKRSQLKLH